MSAISLSSIIAPCFSASIMPLEFKPLSEKNGSIPEFLSLRLILMFKLMKYCFIGFP